MEGGREGGRAGESEGEPGSSCWMMSELSPFLCFGGGRWLVDGRLKKVSDIEVV